MDGKGALPLGLALSTGQLGMAKTLIGHGARINAKTADGEPLLLAALKNGLPSTSLPSPPL